MNPLTFFIGEKVKLSFFTSIPREECISRLREGVAKKRSSKWWDYTSEIAGNIGERKFILWKITLPVYRNSWNPLYQGMILSQDGGSIISGYFDIEWWVKGFTLLMKAFALGAGILIFVLGVNGTIPRDYIFTVSLLMVPIMIALIAGLVRMFIRVGQREYYKIIEFIKTTLVATPNPNDLKRIDLLDIPH